MLYRKKNRKIHKNFSPIGIAHIKATPNNTIISISDLAGNVLCWSSSGTENLGFGSEKLKNAKKKTAYAAQIASKNVAQKALELGIEKLGISIKGKGNGRDICIRTLRSTGLKLIYIEDNTPIAHNGCRPPKRRKL